jgi:hypothetical protein
VRFGERKILECAEFSALLILNERQTTAELESKLAVEDGCQSLFASNDGETTYD